MQLISACQLSPHALFIGLHLGKMPVAHVLFDHAEAEGQLGTAVQGDSMLSNNKRATPVWATCVNGQPSKAGVC